jgi:hypothetical protein
MLAFLFTIIGFYWISLLGISVLPKSLISRNKIFSITISPSIGLALFVFFIFVSSRLGIPMKAMKLPCIILFISSLAYAIFTGRYKSLIRSHSKLVFIIPFGCLLFAWPILKYGFSWLSYVNDDMSNYVLSATRFYNNSYYKMPTSSLYEGKDYSQIFYFHNVTHGIRAGSELFLAVISNARHGDTLQVFMPSILILQMILISSILAVVATIKHISNDKLKFTLALALVLPLGSLGFLYQLIGQVGGLALGLGFIAIANLILSENGAEGDKTWHISILGFLLGAEMIWYPELLPFFVPPVLATLIINKSLRDRKTMKSLFLIFIFLIVSLNHYIIQALHLAFSQVSSTGSQRTTLGNVSGNSALFPYFLKPHGLTSLVGISPINHFLPANLENFSIFMSSLLIAVFLFLIMSHSVFKLLPVVTFLYMTAVLIFLIFNQIGFGAFKMAMYIEPLLVVSCVLAAQNFRKKFPSPRYRVIYFVTIGVLALLSIRTTEFYSEASTGEIGGGFNEIRGASGSSLSQMIKKTVAGAGEKTVISTGSNFSQLKIEAISSRGTRLIFPTTDVFSNFKTSMHVGVSVLNSNLSKINFGKFENNFSQNPAYLHSSEASNNVYLVSNNVYDAINHISTLNQTSPWSYRLLDNPSNLLIFINSDMGPIYYKSTDKSRATFFQPEENPLVPGHYFQSIGDDLLLEVIRPSSHPTLMVSVTSTVIPQYGRKLPDIELLGASKSSIIPVGFGSAQFAVPLVKPVNLNGHLYFQVHINQALKEFPTHDAGISKIYGSNVAWDPRRVALFLSDLSIIDESELSPELVPSSLINFPKDLQDPYLQYSGIYEDGWVGKDSYTILKNGTSNRLTIKGLIPNLIKNDQFKSAIHIKIDGIEVYSKLMKTGYFELNIPTEYLSKEALHKISVNFDHDRLLPKPDLRPASAQITFLGFI